MTVTKNEKLQIVHEPETNSKKKFQEQKTVRLVVEDNRATTITTTVFEAPESPTGVSSVKRRTVMNVHNTFFGEK